MEALILIGGVGSRVKSIENEKPKCLINVSNKPFIYWIILYLLQNGIDKIIFCLSINQSIINHKIESYNFKNIEMKYSRESKPLGTGGAIINAINKITNEDFIVLNGDTIYDIPIKKLLNFHYHNNNDLTYSLHKLNERNTDYGGIEFQQNNQITSHYKLNRDSKSTIIDAGLRIINKKALYNYINSNNSSINKISFEDNIAPWFIKNLKVEGQIFQNEFYDIGNPESYKYTINKFDKMKNKLEKYFEKQ